MELNKSLLCWLSLLVLLHIGHATYEPVTKLFRDQQVGKLIGWPEREIGPESSDKVYLVDLQDATKRPGECIDQCLKAHRRLLDGFQDDDDEDEVFQDEEGSLHKLEEDVEMVQSLWDCEVRCGVLKPVSSVSWDQFAGQGKKLLLWESRAFAEPSHSKVALKELVKLTSEKHDNVPVYLYTYTGWAPGSRQVRDWWSKQHEDSNLRPWQKIPESFGGWGRATLSLVDHGSIVWDIFDIVHSNKHWELIKEYDRDDFDEDHLEEFIPSMDLNGALSHVLKMHDKVELLPFQICVKIARIVLGEEGFHQLAENAHHLDAIADHCGDMEGEKEEYMHEHRGDVDYERFATMAAHMGLLQKASGASVEKEMLRAWRFVLNYFQRDEFHKDMFHERKEKSQVVILASIVPVYEDGVVSGHGVGDRHEAVLLSLCYLNSSIPDDTLIDRYRVNNQFEQPLVNTDIFLSLLPCGDNQVHDVLQCIKAVIADARAGSADIDGSYYEISGIIFGAGFVGHTQYEAVRPYWSADDGLHTDGEFPPEHVSRKYASDQGLGAADHRNMEEHHDEL